MAAFDLKHYKFWKWEKIGMTSVNITLSYKNVKIMQVGTWYLFQPFLFFAPFINNHQQQVVTNSWSSRMTFCILVWIWWAWVSFERVRGQNLFLVPCIFCPTHTRDAEFDLKLSVKGLWSGRKHVQICRHFAYLVWCDLTSQ